MTRKIWHLLSNRWNSAITEYALSSARALELKGCENIFSPLKGSPAEKRALAYGLSCKSFVNFSWRQLMHLRELANSIRPDVILCYGGAETFLTRFLPKNLSVRVVRFRGQELASQHERFPKLFQLSHGHIATIITPGLALSEKVKQITAGHCRVEMVPLGVDTQVFYKDKEVDPFAVDRPELLIVGRFDPVKGHGFLLEVFAALLDTWIFPLPPERKPRLHIIGEPANLTRSDLEAMVRANGLRLGGDVIITCERVENIAQHMTRACLGVVSSLGSEQICRVAEEFLLCGTPVFVSGVGALKDVLFKDAGECYEGRSNGEVLSLLKHLIVRSMEETEVSRELRASMAKSLFSLQTMGRHLVKVLFDAMA